MDLKIKCSALYLPISMSCEDYFRRLLRMSNELLTQPLCAMADQWKQSAGVLFIENIENSFICVNKIIHLITLVMIKNTILKNVILIKKYSTYLHMRNQREPVQKTEQQFLQKMKGNLHISYGKWFYNRSTTLSVLDWTLTDRVVPFIYICVFCLSQGQNRNSTDFFKHIDMDFYVIDILYLTFINNISMNNCRWDCNK